MMQQKERQSIDFRPLALTPLVFIFGISFALVFMAPFRQLMQKIYMFLVTGTIYLFSGVIALLEFIVPERLKNRGETEEIGRASCRERVEVTGRDEAVRCKS